MVARLTRPLEDPTRLVIGDLHDGPDDVEVGFELWRVPLFRDEQYELRALGRCVPRRYSPGVTARCLRASGPAPSACGARLPRIGELPSLPRVRWERGSIFSSPLPVRFSTDAGGCALTLELDVKAPAVAWSEWGAIWVGEEADGRLTALTAYGRSPAEARGLMAMALERLGPRVLTTLASLLGPG